MAGDEIYVTIPGNLTADPELRFTGNGTPVANFSTASTPRIYDRQRNEWRDGETTYLKCTAWRELAENIAESLHRGSPVVVYGKLITKPYETKDGDKRKSMEVEVENLGPNLRHGKAEFTKTPRNNGSQQQSGSQQQGGGQPQGGAPQGGVNDDPWASPADNNAPANNPQTSNSTQANDDPWA